ncbi:hypothetical protein [Kordia sp.]|uniref:hypothetical protein n=1 Tax=Kordia sp. TaxID=1965332 RepID=UPI003D6BE48C
MKKQTKILKLKKATISELNIAKVGEIIGGKTGAGGPFGECVSTYDFRPCFTSPCEATQGC